MNIAELYCCNCGAVVSVPHHCPQMVRRTAHGPNVAVTVSTRAIGPDRENSVRRSGYRSLPHRDRD